MKMINFVGFVLGAITGSAVTWLCLKKKYEQIADGEIASVRDVFNKKMEKIERQFKGDGDTSDDEIFTEEQMEAMDKLCKQYDGREKQAYVARPYIIRPDEFGEIDGYDRVSLTYYEGNDILVDDMNNPISDIDAVIGEESLSHFGDYANEDDGYDDSFYAGDVVYVRNDILKCDYEILLDYDSFSNIEDTGD